MKPFVSDQTRHVFRVRDRSAQQVKLVIECRPGVSQVFPLQPRGDGVWEAVLDLQPGEYRYCYHAYHGRELTYLTPEDAPLEGLKAVLYLGEPGPAEIGRGAPARFASDEPDAPLPATVYLPPTEHATSRVFTAITSAPERNHAMRTSMTAR